MPIDLLDDNCSLIPAAESALREIFARFDVDKDGCLNESELDAFAVASNGEKFSSDDKEQIWTTFETRAGSKLTEDGFIDMFHLQTTSDEEETWKDLRKHGYGDDLKLKK
ncbi:hypothetical protein BDK51DRAFT_17305 [Blyttiomyces helicus]|uniref:EF-hand domain-containing protein n=1 Tax=Blyttiomyces helicus TaxID=388810 RepID=A0A4V1IR36_9FUNG|nr:hypothetical protein BDK51DRAFT_17305 [Blyttiomyces helicus]|eukprot:RKO88687.1 hypothetical protein BDK51DRAFT_17305 [Blyttiomyces helicus]